MAAVLSPEPEAGGVFVGFGTPKGYLTRRFAPTDTVGALFKRGASVGRLSPRIGRGDAAATPQIVRASGLVATPRLRRGSSVATTRILSQVRRLRG